MYEKIPSTENEWLVETVEINLSWVDYGVNPEIINPAVGETAVPRESAVQEEIPKD